ncbi:hypothetical protein SEA_NOSHOW_37 [Mycobacterium phage NoShow]|nr:hypothetical protein SEA_NOSHOW_37 [Mycobacterium phage NoShow]
MTTNNTNARPADIEALRARLIDYVNDSIDQLLDDDYYSDTSDPDDATDPREDLERVERLIDGHNLIHVLYMYENTFAGPDA